MTEERGAHTRQGRVSPFLVQIGGSHAVLPFASFFFSGLDWTCLVAFRGFNDLKSPCGGVEARCFSRRVVPPEKEAIVGHYLRLLWS
jgi:hypothetical protein